MARSCILGSTTRKICSRSWGILHQLKQCRSSNRILIAAKPLANLPVRNELAKFVVRHIRFLSSAHLFELCTLFREYLREFLLAPQPYNRQTAQLLVWRSFDVEY